jgi:hypothetical protein
LRATQLALLICLYYASSCAASGDPVTHERKVVDNGWFESPTPRSLPGASELRGGDAVLLVMKWRDVYDILENAIDRCADVANVLEGIALEG